MQVTIDGPAGVGKTSVGRQAARSFSLLFIQSGQLYRAMAYAKKNGLTDKSVKLSVDDRGETHLTIDGEDVEEKLETEEIGDLASQMAQRRKVRDGVNDIIVEESRDKDVLVEGRDIGTVVLPDADLKIFLTASPRERAIRRHKQLGGERTVDEIEKEISHRDERDKSREIAPLKPAEDAVIIDTTSLTKNEVVNKISDLIRRRAANP
ncbi:MAG: (d)CMP kinase [Candidatus Acetothermia bacterium]